MMTAYLIPDFRPVPPDINSETTMSDIHSFQKLDGFLTDLNAVKKVGDVRGILRKYVEQLGFERFTYWLLWPADGMHIPFYITTYPPAWSRHYIANDFKTHDIIGRHSRLGSGLID